MRAWKLLVSFLITFTILPVSFASDSPEGNWITVDDKTGVKRAIVHLAVKDGVLSGTIVKVFPQPGDTGFCNKCPGRFKDKPVVGLEFVWGLREKSPGKWTGGEILDGRNGKIYRVKMAVKGDKLYVRGYVGVSMMGRTQVWEKAPA